MRNIEKLYKYVKNIFTNTITRLNGNKFNNRLIQLYISNEKFSTFIYINNFIKFFSKEDVVIKLSIHVHNVAGNLQDKKTIDLTNKSGLCIDLKEHFKSLDTYGCLTISAKIFPKYNPKILYLGKLSPQFMTVYVPRDSKNSPQMIHSHKRQQLGFAIRRQTVRHSNHIEDLSKIQSLTFYILNSSRSYIKAKVIFTCVHTEHILFSESCDIKSHGVGVVSFMNHLKIENKIKIMVYYSHYLAHTKPIMFRENCHGITSVNHL